MRGEGFRMSLADDLLLQAKDLLNRDLRKPKQANLRRSVSTAYYSLFYLFIDEVATTVIGGGNERKHLRGYVMRTISHKTIANVCKVFANKNPDNKIKLALAGHEVPDDLADIALGCHNLQDQRHEADYNFINKLSKEEVMDLISQAEEAHRKWKTVKKYEATKVFLIALLVTK